MVIRSYHDPDTGLPYINGLGVDEDEVRQVLRGSGEDLPAARCRQLEVEVDRLKRLVAELLLDKQMLQDIAKKTW